MELGIAAVGCFLSRLWPLHLLLHLEPPPTVPFSGELTSTPRVSSPSGLTSSLSPFPLLRRRRAASPPVTARVPCSPGRAPGLGRPGGRTPRAGTRPNAQPGPATRPADSGLCPAWAGSKAGRLRPTPGLAPVWAGSGAGRLRHGSGLWPGLGRPVGRPVQ